MVLKNCCLCQIPQGEPTCCWLRPTVLWFGVNFIHHQRKDTGCSPSPLAIRTCFSLARFSLFVLWREKGQCQPWPQAIFIGFMLLALRPTQTVFGPLNRPQRDLQINLRQVLKLVSKRPSPGSSDRPWLDPSIGLDQSTDLHQETWSSDLRLPQRHLLQRAGTWHPLSTPLRDVCPGPAGFWGVLLGPKAWLGKTKFTSGFQLDFLTQSRWGTWPAPSYCCLGDSSNPSALSIESGVGGQKRWQESCPRGVQKESVEGKEEGEGTSRGSPGP